MEDESPRRQEGEEGSLEVDLALFAHLEVAASQIPGSGDGLFVRSDVPAGAILAEYRGTTYRTVEAMRLENKDYLMRLGEQCLVDAREHMDVLARYMNDHRHPLLYNVDLVKQPHRERALVRAVRPISAGEELFVDYGPWYWQGFDGRPRKLPPAVALPLLDNPHVKDLLERGETPGGHR
jgi:SET domain-containing protein